MSSASERQLGKVLGMRNLQVLLVLLLFSISTVLLHRHDVGEDLASSYVGCRLVASDQGGHLYSHSQKVFSNVPDRLWWRIGKQSHFAPLVLLHPYVQTPLWAYALIPVCTRMDFRSFFLIFLLLAVLCMSATIWLTARYWAPRMFHPRPIAILCLLLLFSEPYRYAIFLLQTHILFVLMSVIALLLAQMRRPVLAGILLAVAAAVKITPGFLVLYWLLTRKTKAALSFLFASVLLFGMTYLIAGPTLTAAYLREISETSKVLLVSFNVQSLAAWSTGPHFGAWEQLDWKIHTLPAALKLASMLLVVASVIMGGWMDEHLQRKRPGTPPYGAAFALVGATMFTPIAWNHYYVLLVIPILLLLQEESLANTVWPRVLITVIVGLNMYPVRFAIEHHFLGPTAIIRTQWYSGILTLVGLGMAFRRALYGQTQARVVRTTSDAALARGAATFS